MVQVNQMWVVAVRRTKSGVTFWAHMRSECLNIELKIPVFLSSVFPCRDVFLEMSTEREMENRMLFASCVDRLAVKPKQSEFYSFCCKQSQAR